MDNPEKLQDTAGELIAKALTEFWKSNVETKTKTWFLLYDGSSMSDLYGPKYIGRTTDLETAKRHYEKCFNNPYSSGCVDIVTDTKIERASRQTKWDNYEEKQNEN